MSRTLDWALQKANKQVNKNLRSAGYTPESYQQKVDDEKAGKDYWKSKNIIKRLDDPALEKEQTDTTMRDLQTLFAGQRNQIADSAAQQNLGADAITAQQSGLASTQVQQQGDVMLNLKQFFQDQKFKQAALWLQNKGLNIDKKGQENDNAFLEGLFSMASKAVPFAIQQAIAPGTPPLTNPLSTASRTGTP